MNNSQQISLKERFEKQFEEHKKNLYKHDTRKVAEYRSQGYDAFRRLGFPTRKLEDWKNTDLKKALETDYKQEFELTHEEVNVEDLFECKVHDFDTEISSLLNGWYVYTDSPLKKLPDGTIMGSLAKAMKEYPDLVDQYYGEAFRLEQNGFTAMNTAFAQDGVFIYVPDNVKVKRPIQLINIINKNENIFIQNRNLVVIGKNAELTMVHCDDSVNHNISFTNSLTEAVIGENAGLDHYKLQNLNNNSSLINSSFFSLEKNSRLKANAITLNGGLIRNNIHVSLNGENGAADVYGVFLLDREQHVDNQVFIDHRMPNCYSNELFKGILDEKSTGVFNGHIMVRKDAQITNAYQNNKNLLLTDEAKMNAKPFLEIYADDVKCSHGATVGQLDKEAMFYLKSRGIDADKARTLLMYAFAAEVIEKISIEPLKVRIDDMVKRRLRGELSVCDRCVLHCSEPEKEIEFDIDLSKI
ncbi:MAG: Fe-S cluster assembly protein SufD [Bacteroidales bacterium]|nr:Fe-S cluster assembly protein SufD [Bacteroidales bacterium]MCF8344397.1 Fe-S cluster assembly protein SufD [Bacteroidales bacterium]MCF8351969.1 Fe-S cluster assembly protein SufD [Bacteroidales bacterium]MCF8376383.1 Fe-S cluster assembly protein SufD [Bacteroidales bacterium]MCF8401233.1 Fe-S cluster assembly protein SufD [Bacteroidales bacterium]